MGKLFDITSPADPDHRFAPGAFDGEIGTDLTVNVGPVNYLGRLVAVAMNDDGASVTFTVEVPDDALDERSDLVAALVSLDGGEYASD